MCRRAMVSLKARVLGGWLGDRILRDVVVEEVRQLGASYLHVVLGAAWLRQEPPSPGDKVQVFLPDVGARTFTPFDADARSGRFSVIAYLHGESPATGWARSLAVGTVVRFLGPRPSTPLSPLHRPLACFGDETSLGIARAVTALASPADCRVRLEVASVERAGEACVALGISHDSLVLRRRDDAHLGEIAQALSAFAGKHGTVLLTGRAASIQRARALLRASGEGRRQVVRAYWADGKRGLD